MSFETEQDAEIERMAQLAGKAAALREAAAGEPAAVCRDAETSAAADTRRRLRVRVGQGLALPGEVERAFARLAREPDGPLPPPIMLTNPGPVVDFKIESRPGESREQTIARMHEVLETVILPHAADSLRRSIRR